MNPTAVEQLTEIDDSDDDVPAMTTKRNLTGMMEKRGFYHVRHYFAGDFGVVELIEKV